MTMQHPGGGHDLCSFLHLPPKQREFDLEHASLLECFDAMITVKNRRNPDYGDNMCTILKLIRDMQDEYNVTIYPLQITDEFWSLLYPYMESKFTSANTMRTIICQMKSCLGWSSKHGAKVSDSYAEVELPSCEINHIALTPNDVSRIYNAPIEYLECRPQLKRTFVKVKDMFCLMCNLGLRYSDARRLCKDHFTHGVCHILQEKTEGYAHIDINNMCIHRDMVNEILEKYDYTAPYNHDCNEFNKLLHKLLFLIGYTDEYMREKIYRGKVTQEKIPKYKLITSHSARRTFVVNNALRGKSDLEIRRATGHKSYEALRKYLKYFN